MNLATEEPELPAEIQWAKDMYACGILPDENQRLAKALAKTFDNKRIRNTPWIWRSIANNDSRQYEHCIALLRSAAKHLGKIRGTIFLPYFDRETAKAIKGVLNHLIEGERLVTSLLQELDADHREKHKKIRQHADFVTGKMVCRLKETVERENRRRRACNPPLPVYRNEWRIVVELLKMICPNGGETQYYTPSVNSVRQLAYRHKRRAKRQIFKKRK